MNITFPTNCHRCNRRFSPKKKNASRWNATFKAGLPVAVTCPTCQTAAEDLEAKVNEATTAYGATVDGRFYGRPRGGAR